MNSLLRVEFHCYTIYSEDSLTSPQQLAETCQNKKIDRVVVTDHNTIAGAIEAHALDPERVIIGEEIQTTAGELLAAFILEEIPAGLEPIKAIRLLNEQCSFISVSHPFDRFRSPWDKPTLNEILPYIDAIEAFNARCIWPGFNWDVATFGKQNAIPGISGSEAHTLSEVGAATLLLESFHDADGLRKIIRQAKRHNQLSGPWVHFASRRVTNIKQKWDKYNW
jgi:predicted metal-dependent phosphoesterase TrpH